MGLQSPHGKFPNVQLHVLERIEQTGKLPILESGNILKFTAILQNARLGEHLIDPVHPFLQIPAAALQDQAVFAFHVPQVIGCDRIDIQINRLLSFLLMIGFLPAGFCFRLFL